MIHLDMPEPEYRALPGLSGTGCAEIMKSPAHFKTSLAGRTETPAMALGTAAHKMILEGSTAFDNFYIVAGQCCSIKKDNNRCDNPAIVQSSSGHQFCGVHSKTFTDCSPTGLISADDRRICLSMYWAIKGHRIAAALLCSPGNSEVVLTATDPETGATVKGRVDRLPDVGPYLVDLKTTADVLRWKPDDYLLQACHYLELCRLNGIDRIKGVAFVVVETSDPFGVRVIVLDVEALKFGAEQLRQAWDLYARCMETGNWPSLDRGLEVVSLSYRKMREAGA